MFALIVSAALAASAQQDPAPAPPVGIAPHQQQVDTIVPSAQPGTPAAPQPTTAARRAAHHKRIHVGKATVARASRAAGGAVAGPAGAAVAPVLVDGAGHKVKTLVHRRRHHAKPAAKA